MVEKNTGKVITMGYNLKEFDSKKRKYDTIIKEKILYSEIVEFEGKNIWDMML